MTKKVIELDCEKFLQRHNGEINKDFTRVRITKSDYHSIYGNKYTYAYLDLKDGVIISASYGFGKFKGYKLVNCENAYKNVDLRMRNIFTGEFD